MSKKFLYLFKEGHDAFGGDQTTMKNTLGGKGAGLAEMTHAGMPVPQGFTITTEACTQYYADNREINDEIKADIFKYMGILEEQTGKTFGSIENPLLVSVRSGARQSMPGMMDTILNLGLNDQAVEGLAKKTNNPRFAYDCYRRFIQMYSDVVMEVGKKYFEQLIDQMKAKGEKIFTRMDTNGTGSLINGRDIAPDFAGRFDMVSVSLNTDTAEKYNALCHPQQENAYEAMKDFTKEVRKYVPTVMMTVVDTIPPEEIEACRKICEEEIGATYRVREYIKD